MCPSELHNNYDICCILLMFSDCLTNNNIVVHTEGVCIQGLERERERDHFLAMR